MIGIKVIVTNGYEEFGKGVIYCYDTEEISAEEAYEDAERRIEKSKRSGNLEMEDLFWM